MSDKALGLIETKGLIGAIEAVDAAAKAAAVVVSSVELTEAAFMTLKIEGDLGAVQAAVEAGAAAAGASTPLVESRRRGRPELALPPRRADRNAIKSSCFPRGARLTSACSGSRGRCLWTHSNVPHPASGVAATRSLANCARLVP